MSILKAASSARIALPILSWSLVPPADLTTKAIDPSVHLSLVHAAFARSNELHPIHTRHEMHAQIVKLLREVVVVPPSATTPPTPPSSSSSSSVVVESCAEAMVSVMMVQPLRRNKKKT